MTEVKYIRPELIEAIARNTLKNYDASLILGYEAKSVPIEDIIESMGLSLEFQYIRKNGRILGETVFDDDYVPIYNMDEKRYELIFVERGTIPDKTELVFHRSTSHFFLFAIKSQRYQYNSILSSPLLYK